MSVKFYRCPVCGNIVVYVKESRVPVMCCGQKMQEIVPNTVDAAVEKHVPVVEVNGRDVLVKVGSVEHPMVPEHFIEFIVLETCCGYQVKHLKAGDAPEAKFTLNEGAKVLAVYEYCNLHGLWKKEL